MKPYIIGLTGQTGAGKTTVARVMTEVCGAEHLRHIDCDAVTRHILDEDRLAHDDILRRFPGFFTEGIFDRRKAAAALFSDKALLERYDAAIFPHITRQINGLIDDIAQDFAGQDDGFHAILLDAPTLFEAGLEDMCGCIVSCIAPAELRVKRITARDGITEEQARARISSQHDDEFFRQRSDHIIVNDGGEQSLINAAVKTIGDIAAGAVR